MTFHTCTLFFFLTVTTETYLFARVTTFTLMYGHAGGSLTAAAPTTLRSMRFRIRDTVLRTDAWRARCMQHFVPVAVNHSRGVSYHPR